MAVSKESLGLLMNYHWPGNIRELQNAIQFSIVRCSGNIITTDDLPMEFKDGKDPGTKKGPLKKLHADAVKNALSKTGGNKTKTAKVLGVGRATLYRFLDEHEEILKDFRIE